MPDGLSYLHPSDNLIASITPTITVGTAESGYGVDKLVDNDPSVPFRTSIGAFALTHHNLSAALSGVRFQVHSTSNFTTPDHSHSVVVPAYQGSWPTNIGLEADDLTGFSGRYVSFAVTSANAVNVALGEIAIATAWRSVGRTLAVGLNEPIGHPMSEHLTPLGASHRWQYGQRSRAMAGEIVLTSSDSASLRAWQEATKSRSLASWVWPCGLEPDEPWYALMDAPERTRQYRTQGLHVYRLGFTEVSRGLIPTPSAV
jgi:hypothetical protein